MFLYTQKIDRGFLSPWVSLYFGNLLTILRLLMYDKAGFRKIFFPPLLGTLPKGHDLSASQ
jgi:hypothetical protein